MRFLMRTLVPLLCCVAMVAALIITPGADASSPANTAVVTTDADSGEGSFRAAVEAANSDRKIKTISFDGALVVSLSSSVVYSGSQNLTIEGNGSTLSGTYAAPAITWDSGLFASTDAKRITIEQLALVDSPNNGIGMFVPAGATGTYRLTLTDVTVTGAQFHGVFFDGQASEGYNTDDEPHPACTDPYPVDSQASLRIAITNSEVSGNGILAPSFDDTIATGCPRDFDGVRVDDGGLGGITAELTGSTFNANLADGVELDESERGGVNATVVGSTFNANGNSGVQPDGFEDLDDGFDIDEAGPGNLVVSVSDTQVLGNFDEGLDFDEEDAGTARVTVNGVDASGNDDEGIKIDEAGNGNLRATINDSDIAGNGKDGIEFTEEDAGNLNATVSASLIAGNDDAGIKAEAEDPGNGRLTLNTTQFVDTDGLNLDLTGVRVSGDVPQVASTDPADTATDAEIAAQRAELAAAFAAEPFGPQSPRNIDVEVGTNPVTFATAPPPVQMNLCNIHFHEGAEHAGGQFTTYAGNGDGEGYGTGYLSDLPLSSNELRPYYNDVGATDKGNLTPGDTIEIHYVHTTDPIVPGPTLGSCLAGPDTSPQLRVEAQVFVIVNDDDAESLVDLTEIQQVGGFFQAVNIPNNTGTPVEYLGSTTGPKFNIEGSLFEVSWSVRPEVIKISISSVEAWLADNIFEEEAAQGVRNLVINPDLLSEIDGAGDGDDDDDDDDDGDDDDGHDDDGDDDDGDDDE